MRKEIIVVGRMDHTLDNTLESLNRVYGGGGISPTVTAGGGDHVIKILGGYDLEENQIHI